MENRLLQAGLIKPKVRPPSVAQTRRRVVERRGLRFARNKLYEEIWQKPATELAESYGVSGVYLGRVCRTLGVPGPPRGYWAKVRSGALLPPLLPRNDAAHVLVEHQFIQVHSGDVRVRPNHTRSPGQRDLKPVARVMPGRQTMRSAIAHTEAGPLADLSRTGSPSARPHPPPQLHRYPGTDSRHPWPTPTFLSHPPCGALNTHARPPDPLARFGRICPPPRRLRRAPHPTDLLLVRQVLCAVFTITYECVTATVCARTGYQTVSMILLIC